MQDRYVGDVGDFGKYGLLRCLIGLADQELRLKLGVLWYRVRDESHNNDGAKTGYLFLEDPSQFADCDPVLFSELFSLVKNDQRSLEAIERSKIFPKGTRFSSAPLCFSRNGPGRYHNARSEQREAWIQAGYRATQKCDIVFADPDNGLECHSVGPLDRFGPKYAFVGELLPLIRRGQSVVVYHHTCRRGTAEQQAMDRLRTMNFTKSSFAMLFRRGSSRAFLIIPAKRHAALLRRRIKRMMQSAWKAHFRLVVPASEE